MISIKEKLKSEGIRLVRDHTETLQVNTGLLCNQACKHCHLNAGPHQKETLMSREMMKHVIRFAENNSFKAIDITGGAPEMNPDLPFLIRSVSSLAPEVILRSNLTAIGPEENGSLTDLLVKHRITITASFPSLNEIQTNGQRGTGIYEKSIKTLKLLNSRGYGSKESDLVLNLVSNPAGAFMPQNQCSTEKRFREVLKKKWDISFNSLFSFANVPLGRFQSWLETSGNHESYMNKLAGQFNPEAANGIMCRSLISVSWDGYLYDCDFNQPAGLYAAGKKRHISETDSPPEPGSDIAVSNHCFACMAGSGFT